MPNLKPLLLAAALTVAGAALAQPQGHAAKPITIQPQHVSVRATVDSFILPVKGGSFSEVKGQIHVDLDKPERSRMAITVDTRKADAGTPRYTAFLSGPSILNVAEHPQMRFVSRAATRLDAHRLRFDGDLTLRGVTRPLAIVATIVPDSPQGRPRFTARGQINRLEFGINRGYPLITAMVDFVLTTQPPAE